ncbi:MAG TPA: hypothetical protein VL286_06560 [Rhizomicrobium sp.]|nr:hypothetical protein [Rhizomicrobium sp.]
MVFPSRVLVHAKAFRASIGLFGSITQFGSGLLIWRVLTPHVDGDRTTQLSR